MWLATLRTFGSLAGIAYPKVAKGAADALERLVLEVRYSWLHLLVHDAEVNVLACVLFRDQMFHILQGLKWLRAELFFESNAVSRRPRNGGKHIE